MKNKIVIYQVLPRLFGNINGGKVKSGTLEENGSGKFGSFQVKALREIKKLGCTHIWYTGVIEHATETDFTELGIPKDHPAVIKGVAGSPYAIKDYYDVNPYLAKNSKKRMQEFEQLLERTHKQGLSVIIDFVPNHVARRYHSDVSPLDVDDFGVKDDTELSFSPNNNFYYMPHEMLKPQLVGPEDATGYVEFPAKATGNDCFHAYPSTNDWYETVKLNYGVDYVHGGQDHFDPVPDTWRKMRAVLLYWAAKGVDGFRCDMAEMVPVAFWAWVIPRIKKEYPHLIFIAEVYNPGLYYDYLMFGGFDYLYDKVGLYDTLRAVTCGWSLASAIPGCWQATDAYQGKMLHFMENHDEQRIASSFFANDPLKAFPSMIVSATIDKAPLMVYFGQELGEKGMEQEGFSGVDGRTTIFDYWKIDSVERWYNEGKCSDALLTDEEKTIRSFYSKLLNITSKEQAISEGQFHDLMYVNCHKEHFDQRYIYAYLRKYADELLLVIVNFAETEQKVNVCIPHFILQQMGIDRQKDSILTDLLSGTTVHSSMTEDWCVDVILGAFDGMILKRK